MVDTGSNQKLDSLAAAIFARHGVEFARAERAGGWTNAVWLTETLVLRLSTSQENENLLREARLATRFPAVVGYPLIVETGKTDGFAWSLAARLPGIPLGEAWEDLHWEERTTALQELWERAGGVHSVPVAEIPSFVPRRAWFNSTEAGEAEASLLRLTEAGIFAASESQVLRNALERFWCALPPSPCVLCHGDLTPGNALWHAGHVTSLLDFEFAVLAPIQLDLNHLIKLAFGPSQMFDSDRQGDIQFRRAVKELALPLLTQAGSFDLLMGYAILLELWLLELWLAHPEGEGPLEQWEPLRRLRSLADGRGGYLATLSPGRQIPSERYEQ
jgi:aminoglycoside phosphotransferase (APT) family kinase protein